MVRTFSEVILIRPLCHESKILAWTIFVALAGEALAKQISLKDQDQPSFELGCESLCEDEVTTGLATSLTVSSGSQRLSSQLHTFYFLITPPAPSPPNVFAHISQDVVLLVANSRESPNRSNFSDGLALSDRQGILRNPQEPVDTPPAQSN